MQHKHTTQTALLLSPWLLVFVVFWLYPLAHALYLSFTDYATLTNTTTWIGLGNYERLFQDEVFWTALGNTSFFVIGTIPFTTIFALILAVLLNRELRFTKFFKSAFFMPSVTSLVVISLVFTNLYAGDGTINGILDMLGLPFPEHGWLLDTGLALPAIMAMEVWIATGYYMVLFLAALQTIPNDLYEAAELAGASAWEQFRLITVPLLKPTLTFVVVINTIKSFQVFVEIYVMTRGGPLDSTTTLIYQVFVAAFEKSDQMGYASALAWVVFVLIGIFAAIQFKFLRVKS